MSLTDRTLRMITVASIYSNTDDSQVAAPDGISRIGQQISALGNPQGMRTSVCGNPIAK